MGYDLIVGRLALEMKHSVEVSGFNDARYCGNTTFSNIMHHAGIIYNTNEYYEDFYRPKNEALSEIKNTVENMTDDDLPNKHLWLRLTNLMIEDHDIWLYDSN
jgi:hypothetical protein